MIEPLPAMLVTLDQALYELVSGLDILDGVAPLNYREEKARFFECHFSQRPEFVYKQHCIETFKRKRQLFSLPVEQLPDPDLVQLYSEVVESYVDKVDQYQSIGTPEFLYDSLRYYGEPSEKDIRNAHFILHLPDSLDDSGEAILDAVAISAYLERFARREGYPYQAKLDDSMIANALVSGTTVKINTAARVPETEVSALAHHELGVHLVTTLNGRSQPLRVLSVGSPVNTMTQEGMAILSEYLAGCMTLSRLKVLALRVLAVDSMIREKDFKKTFLLLKEEHGVDDHQAFTITVRVYRGGGLTKDYLYLQGLHQMLNAYETLPNFELLLCGKVSQAQLPLVSRLIDKGYLVKPRFITPAMVAPVESNQIKQFIAHAIK